MAKEVTERSKGELVMEFHGGTLLTKELEIINAVKSGNIAMGDPGGAAATVFPEMGVFLVPYLIASYDQAYKLFNGAVGDRLDKQFQDKYKLKILFFYDYGFRHFWNNKRPIAEPKDLRGLKMRVQQAKVFADTINGLGGVAVPMAWGEVIPAAQQGVIDGADLPIVNILALTATRSEILLDDLSQLRADRGGDQSRRVERLTEPQRKLLQDASRNGQPRCAS
jgi:TRAP-type C4-dicarboxylate transport system substrate-binding protein